MTQIEEIEILREQVKFLMNELATANARLSSSQATLQAVIMKTEKDTEQQKETAE